MRSSSQKTFKCSKELIGDHEKCWCALARALRAKMIHLKNIIFHDFLVYRRVGARFPRAQPRARPCGVRHRTATIQEMSFDYLIVSIALKLANIFYIEVLRETRKSRKIRGEKSSSFKQVC